jgi:hypothetical protein
VTTPDTLDADDINDNIIALLTSTETQNKYSTLVLAASAKAVWSSAQRELHAKQLVAHILSLYSIPESTLLSLPTDLLKIISQM